MRSTGSYPRFKPAVDHQSRSDRVSHRPKRRREAGRGGVQLRVTPKFTGELKRAANLVRERKIELIVLTEPAGAPLPDPEMRCVEIKMDPGDVLAGEE